MEIIKFQPEQTDLVRKTFERNEGWFYSDYGTAMACSEIPGYKNSPARFKYGLDPSNLELFGSSPLVVSRFTPENQRLVHLNRQVDYQISDTYSIKMAFVSSIKGGMGRHKFAAGVTFDPNELAMVDAFVFLPHPGESGKVYFDRSIGTLNCEGACLIVEGNKYKQTSWVNRNPNTGEVQSSLPIKPFGDELNDKVFTVDGTLDVLTAEGIHANSITAVTMISDFLKPKSSSDPFGARLLPNSASWDLNELLNNVGPMKTMALHTMGGIDWGKLGESADTGRKVVKGQALTELRHGMILNIYPLLISNQITEQQLRQLTCA